VSAAKRASAPKYIGHVASVAFPLMTGVELDRLVDDIKRNGLQDEIVLIKEGKVESILDGRNRDRACELAHVKPRYTYYEGDDPLGYVITKNLLRRHLNESQRALVAARLAQLPAGRPKKGARSSGLSEDKAAKLLNVGRSTVGKAKAVLAKGTPELVQAVERGDMAVDEAAKVARLNANHQHEAITGGAPGKPKFIRVTGQLTHADLLALRALVSFAASSNALPIVKAGGLVVARLIPALEDVRG
jgi:hypothetical protein